MKLHFSGKSKLPKFNLKIELYTHVLFDFFPVYAICKFNISNSKKI